MAVLARFLSGGEPARAIEAAERVLTRCPMRGGALESLTAALAVLIYADRADRAAAWCAPLLEQTTHHCDPRWQGFFAAVRAHTSLRQGLPDDAADAARVAFAHLGLREWGVAVGLPLAAMIEATVLLGRHEDAARYLAIPVPEPMFRTPAGLHYLWARARHHLAAERWACALDDLRRCADLTRAWGLDLPGAVPWRLAAAEARSGLGDGALARELLEEQLELAPPGADRTRGMALRRLAAASEPTRRPALLERAAGLLQASGDRRESAAAIAELAAAWGRLGNGAPARTAERRALHLSRAGAGGRAVATAPLSDTERRVATMAAQGMTNKQISERLYVTVSTVEQHLTRIYRKLGVRRRSELPAGFEMGVAG